MSRKVQKIISEIAFTSEDLKRRGACSTARYAFERCFGERLSFPDPYHDWEAYVRKMQDLIREHPNFFACYNDSIAFEYALREIHPKELIQDLPLPPAKYVLEDTVGVPKRVVHSKLTGKWNCDEGSRLDLEYCKISELEMYGNRFGDLILAESVVTNLVTNFREMESLQLIRTYFSDYNTRENKTHILDFMCQHSTIYESEFDTKETYIRWSDLMTSRLEAQKLESDQSYFLSIKIKAESVELRGCQILNTRIRAPKIELYNCTGEVYVPEETEIVMRPEGSVIVRRKL